MTTPYQKSFWRDKARPLLRLWGSLYLLMLATIVLVLVFNYFPKFEVIIKAFYRWEPPVVEEYIGLKNFRDALGDPLFAQSFQLVGILLATNLLKMWPGILAAVCLHRLVSDRLRYLFQVCFVVPMVIPGMVWLLIWKSFYDPDFGILNRFLNASGLMSVLHRLDGSAGAPGLMPRLADSLAPLFSRFIDPVFGHVGGMVLAGIILLSLAPFFDGVPTRKGSGRWVWWFFLVLAGVVVWSADWLRLGLTLAAGVGVALLVRRALPLQVGGWLLALAGSLLVVLGKTWVEPTGQFAEGTPAWLGSKDLVIPALLFWGFPWVGTVGVLIYLSGLQQISQDVYEAADLDGVGPIGKFFHIELPLITTQLRINLIFMTIGTLTGYEMFLILLGPSGGPGNKGMVPGLYMFAKAFQDGNFGYACALGMVMFVAILTLTVIYNRYVKVEK